jgi:phosphate transport system substrate-binding protein
VKPFAFAFAALLALAASPQTRAQDSSGAAAFSGAGSTFAFPLVARWSKAYQRWQSGGGDYTTGGGGLDDPPTGPPLDYEPIGSLAGMMRVKEAAVDFGATDAPLRSEDLRKLGLAQFPLVMGGVVAVVNIEGVAPAQIRFTGQLLADIFLGKTRTWSDPAITALNPGLKLPDAPIAVIRRSDGSGTTFNFASYLAKASPEWRSKVGADLVLNWPAGVGARGNEGVSLAVRQTRNSIGYVEFGHALQLKLSYALIRNQAGRFATPSAAAFQAAAAGADWTAASDFHLLLTDMPGENAYPIVATVFVLMHRTAAPRRTRAAMSFFQWALDKGGKDAAELGYTPLPDALVAQIKTYWAKSLGAGL